MSALKELKKMMGNLVERAAETMSDEEFMEAERKSNEIINKLAVNDKLDTVDELRDKAKAIAHDIAHAVSHHIDIMYPEAVKAASSTFLLSVRGCVYNEIMNIRENKYGLSVEEWIKERQKHRRLIKKMARAGRGPDSVSGKERVKMAATYELIMQAEKELNAAKGEIAAGPVTDRLIDVCELLLEVVGRIDSRPNTR